MTISEITKQSNYPLKNIIKNLLHNSNNMQR